MRRARRFDMFVPASASVRAVASLVESAHLGYTKQKFQVND